MPLILFCGWLDKENKSTLIHIYHRQYLVLTPTALHWFEAPLGSTPSSYSSASSPVLFGNHKGSLPLASIESLTFEDKNKDGAPDHITLTHANDSSSSSLQVYKLRNAETASRASPSVAAWYAALMNAKNECKAHPRALTQGRSRHASISGSYLPSIPAIALVTSDKDRTMVFSSPDYDTELPFAKCGTQLSDEVKLYLVDGSTISVPLKVGKNTTILPHPLVGPLDLTVTYKTSGINFPAGGTLITILGMILSMAVPTVIDGIAHTAFPTSILTYALSALFALIMFKDKSMSDLSHATFAFNLAVQQDPLAAPTTAELEADAAIAAGANAHTCIHAATVLFKPCYTAETDEIDMAQLLVAADAFLDILKAMGPSMMLAVKDFENNMKKSRSHYLTDKTKYATMKSLLEGEKETGIHKPGGIIKDPSSAAGLLWIRRSLAYQLAIFEALTTEGNEDMTLTQATQIAYDKELLQYHAWMLKAVFGRVIASVPSKEVFGEKVAAPGVPEAQRRAVVEGDMKEFVDIVGPVLECWKKVYGELDLEDSRKV